MAAASALLTLCWLLLVAAPTGKSVRSLTAVGLCVGYLTHAAFDHRSLISLYSIKTSLILLFNILILSLSVGYGINRFETVI